jgi:hypothetical protein
MMKDALTHPSPTHTKNGFFALQSESINETLSNTYLWSKADIDNNTLHILENIITYANSNHNYIEELLLWKSSNKNRVFKISTTNKTYVFK